MVSYQRLSKEEESLKEIMGPDQFSLIKKSGSNLFKITKEFSDIQEVVGYCVAKSPDLYFLLGESKKNNPYIIKRLLQTNGLFLEKMPPQVKDNEEFVRVAIASHFYSSKFISDRLKKSKPLALYSVNINGLCLNYFQDNFNQDAQVVYTALKSNGCALAFVSDDFKNDKSIVIKAVKKSGRALEFAPNIFKDNLDVVTTAIKQNCTALEFASERLKDCAQLILNTVAQNKYMLRFASDRIKEYCKSNTDIVITLESLVLKDKLDSELTHNQPGNTLIRNKSKKI